MHHFTVFFFGPRFASKLLIMLCISRSYHEIHTTVTYRVVVVHTTTRRDLVSFPNKIAKFATARQQQQRFSFRVKKSWVSFFDTELPTRRQVKQCACNSKLRKRDWVHCSLNFFLSQNHDTLQDSTYYRWYP